LVALAVLTLDAATGLAAAPGLAFLVLVAFNSCLLIETQGARWGKFKAPPGCLLDRRASVQASQAGLSYAA
jgi:hypothetical protein